MKNLTMLALLALLGLSVSCSDRSGDGIQEEEAFEEAGHEMDEVGDDVEDAAEELD